MGVLRYDFDVIFPEKTIPAVSFNCQSTSELTHMKPIRTILLSFLGLILTGTLLLLVPGVSTGETLSFMDALFLATSAVCVTGLSTLDISVSMTTAGHAILLVLIQLGGIGIITLSSFLLFLSRKRVSIAAETMLGSTVALSGKFTFRKTTASIVKYTFIIEAFGALILFFTLPASGNIAHRLWVSLFHSISAFCNAGFSLFSDNLEGILHSPSANFAVMILIILGGIGFVNLQELSYRIKKRDLRWKRFSLFLKISLSFTLALIILGGFFVFIFENGAAFKDLSFGESLVASLFLSVTSRTAGFNTFPMAALSNETLFLISLLMFIGGVSGSCAGGVKINTLAVVFGITWSRIKNFPHPSLFQRRFSRDMVRKTIALIFLSQLTITLAILLLQATEVRFLSHTESKGTFLEYAFEVVSALGTVGLSTGVTTKLSSFGKFFIIILMYLGRLGPLTFAFAWLNDEGSTPYTFPEENIPIG
jgi:trk system potassium uptake protein TrkH